MRKILFTLFLFLFTVSQLNAQEDCPAIVEAALQAAADVCTDTSRNQACYGNVNLEAVFDEEAQDVTFTQQGDIADIGAIQSLSLSSLNEDNGEWGVALMRVQANLPDTLPGQNVTFLLFGDVEIQNAAVEQIYLPISATGNINVRGEPSTNAAIVGGLSSGEVVTANGRLEDTSWLRVTLEDGTNGWVFADLVTAEGDVNTLAAVTADDAVAPALNPMQAFYFRTGVSDAPCAEAPESGILIQTPEGAGQVTFNINEVNITLGSTAFLQAEESGHMTIHMIEHQARVGAFDVTETVPAGMFIQVPLDENLAASGPPEVPQPYDRDRLTSLPLGNLERNVTLPDPLTDTTPFVVHDVLVTESFDDALDDPKSCDANQTAMPDSGMDISSVSVEQTETNFIVNVQMQNPVPIDENVLVNIRVGAEASNYKMYLWQSKNGTLTTGLIDTHIGEFVPSNANIALLNGNSDGRTIQFDIPKRELHDGTTFVDAASVHSAQTETQPSACDLSGPFTLTSGPVSNGVIAESTFTDNPNDGQTCDTQAAVDDTEVDIASVVIQQISSSVIVDVHMQTPLQNDYSFAIVISNQNNAFMWEIHDGVLRSGEIDPTNGRTLPTSDRLMNVEHNREAGIVSFDFSSDGQVDAQDYQLFVNSFHTPSKDMQPQPAHCDRAGPFNFP